MIELKVSNELEKVSLKKQVDLLNGFPNRLNKLTQRIARLKTILRRWEESKTKTEASTLSQIFKSKALHQWNNQFL